MNSIMLGTSQQLLIASILRTLQTTHHTLAHHGRQIWVFTISLLPTSPTRVAEDVDVGCPKRQMMIHLPLRSKAACLIILDASLIAHSSQNALHKHGVERRSHTHRNGKHCGMTISPHAMQRLVPPLEHRHIESFNSMRVVHHQAHLLLQSQSSANILCTLLRSKLRVLIRITPCLRCTTTNYNNSGQQKAERTT